MTGSSDNEFLFTSESVTEGHPDKMADQLSDVRKDGTLGYLRPDGKTQVTVRYVDGRPVEIEKILISTQHAEEYDSQTQIKPDLWENVIRPVLPEDLYDEAKLRRNFL